MLKREDIKQAIDAIAARDPEIGYALDRMFGTGRIDVGGEADNDRTDADPYFLFDNQPVPIKKIIFFNEGPGIIEERLLVKYGELIKKQEIDLQRLPVDFRRVARSIREAGLELMVRHEIDYAWSRLQAEPAAGDSLPAAAGSKSSGKGMALSALCRRFGRRADEPGLPQTASDSRVLFSGVVDADMPAYFIQFPYTLDALMQMADLDLEFFHVRFALQCLEKGTDKNLFACVVDGAIVGLVYLAFKKALFYKGMEIKYLASIGRSIRDADDENRRPLRGVGTFLVAGVWMLWKNWMPDVDEILLDSEIQAIPFYDHIGFKSRRQYVYVLKHPIGSLLKAIAVMADRSRSVRSEVVGEISRLIKGRIRILLRRPGKVPQRDQSLQFLKACLSATSQPMLAQTAARLLLKHKQRIPEAENLLEFGTRNGRIRLIDINHIPLQPLLVLRDPRFSLHLQGIFHLENSKRLDAIETILQDPILQGKWASLSPRAAGKEELAWVHTVAHIERVAATAGKKLLALDLDTQTTSGSYESASLAVGGVFKLLDEIWNGRARRGFAAIRPPGHHAEPGKAMGFCLFNNIALGACYLQHAYGVKKIMIVDIDAHHGNGTQTAFYTSNSVLFFSMHQFPCYPGTGNFGETGGSAGEGYNVNVPLSKGLGDREFVQVIHFLVSPLACAFEPEIILISCGFDLYRHDRLAGMQGTPEGYAMITRLLLEIADTVCGGKIAFIMEGGYSIQGIRECGMAVIKEMCALSDLNQDRLDNFRSDSPSGSSFLRKSIEIQKRYWKVFT